MGKKRKDQDLQVNPLSKILAKKRKLEKKEDDVPDDVKVMLPDRTGFNHIKCKAVRQQKYAELKKEKKKAKKADKKLKADTKAPKQVPRTLENTREVDVTTVKGDINEEENEELKLDLDTDEFAAYYQKSYEPKVLITYADNPLQKTRIFGRELSRIIPNSIALYRNRSSVKKMVKEATERNFTDVIVINENMRKPNGLLIIHLPEGPTMHVKLSNVKLTTDLKRNHKEITSHRPEVVLSNFTTRLGFTVGRMLGALFHYDPEFKGRRVVTFHNQRDYIFFRHHRYEFDTKKEKAKLRELGPRFTMRLRSIQQGTFDSKYGEYEWLIQGKRHAMETSRRRFFL